MERFDSIWVYGCDAKTSVEFEEKRFGAVDGRFDEEIATAGFERDFSQSSWSIGLG